jgi:hypothetical protein
MHPRLVGYLVIASATLLSFYGTINKPDCQDMDFGAYYRAAVAVSRGQTPYTVDEYGPLGVYPYAPAYAYLLIPLRWLNYIWACRLWMLLNWVATIAVFVVSLRLVHRSDEERGDGWSVALLAALATASYVWANVRVGQIAMFMLLGCLGWDYCRRQGKEFLGGMLLATACAIKLAPCVLIPYLAITRGRRGFAGLLVGGVLLFLLPSVWVGWSGTIELHKQWVEHTLATHVPMQTYRPGNQSVLAQLARLPAISNGHECFSPDALAALWRWYPLVVAALVAAFYFVILRMRSRERDRFGDKSDEYQDSVNFALLLVFMTLVNPRGWRCNMVALIFPFVLLARQMLRGPIYLSGLIAFATVLLAAVWPTNGVGQEGWSLTAWLLLGKHFWGGVAVGVACWRLPRQDAAQGTQAGYRRRPSPSSRTSTGSCSFGACGGTTMSSPRFGQVQDLPTKRTEARSLARHPGQ